MTSHVKPVGIALSGAHLSALLADPRLTARLNATGLPFAVAGVDRVDRAIPRSGTGATGSTVESSFAAAALAARAPGLGWLAVAAAHRDQPYDLARRIASDSQRTGGRSGLVLGLRDRSAPAGHNGGDDWVGGLIDSPPSVAATRVAAAAIRALWQGWSADPVLAWRAESTGEAAAARGVADILFWPAGRPERLDAVAAASSGGPRLFLEVPAGGADLAARLVRHLGDDRVAGVVLRPEASEIALREFIRSVVPELAGSGVVRAGWSGPLRARLSPPAGSWVPGDVPAGPRLPDRATALEPVR